MRVFSQQTGVLSQQSHGNLKGRGQNLEFAHIKHPFTRDPAYHSTYYMWQAQVEIEAFRLCDKRG